MVVEAPNDPFADNVSPHLASWQVDAEANADALLNSLHLGNWDPIRDGTAVTQEDYARQAEKSVECMLKKQRRQNDRDMQDVPRYVATKNAKKNKYAKQYAKERLLARQEDQKQRRIFSNLQEQDNRQKLRRPFSRSYTPVPMGLPLTSEEWMTDSATWHEKHEEKSIIDVVSPENDKMEAYYFEGTKLYKVRTDESYDREDRNLAASLRQNAAAAAAAAATAATDAWE
jgi:hypothetical protein